MHTLLTGGAGYVGSVLVDDLLARGHTVRVLDNLRSRPAGGGPPDARPGVEFVRADIRDTGAVARSIDGCDVIVHLAAIVGYPACDAAPEEAQSVNVDGTRSLLDAAAGRPVVLASSLSCLGKVGARACDESTEPLPVSLYGETKLAAERLALGYGEAVVLRPSTAFGASPWMRFDLLVHQLVRDALQWRRIDLYEPGATRSFVHVRDLAASLAFAAEEFTRLRGGVFHVGNDQLNVTKMELAQLVRDAVDCEITVNHTDQDHDQRDYAGDFAKMAAAGLTLRRSLPSGIRELAGLLRRLDAQGGVDGGAMAVTV